MQSPIEEESPQLHRARAAARESPDDTPTIAPRQQRLRILYVRSLYRPVDFGGNRYAVEVTTRLAARGHAVTVVTGRLGAVDPSWRGVDVVQYPRSRRHPLLTFATNAVSSRVAVASVIRRFRPDVVMVSSWDCGYGYYAVRASRRPPSVFVYHSSFYSEAVRALAKRSRYRRVYGAAVRFQAHVERVVLGSADRIVAVSSFSRKEIEDRLGRASDPRCEVISTGVDTELFSPGDRRRARAALGLPEGALVLAVVGRLTLVKRYDRAVRALSVLRSQGRDALLLIIGQGDEEQALRELAAALGVADHVRFEGFRDGVDLVERLRAADYQLCTSEFENWSLALIEALACGTPVLGTPYGGTPELLGAVDPALVLRGGSEDDVVAAIEALEADHDSRDALARRCRAHALRFGWKHIIDRLESTLLATASPGRNQ